VAPYVETAEQVQALRGALKLKPIKGQRLREMLDDAPIEPELGAYLERGARERLLVVNIESGPAIKALDEILAVPGLDAVLIGPHDLSCNLGLPEHYDHPDFLGACETIFRKARAAGVGAGIHFWGEIAQQAHFLKLGANLLIHSADITLFRKHLAADLQAIRQAAGIAKEAQGQRVEVNI
jgi:2-keto-3-deoxy-L-rhamnonate aldolase RhmA